MVSIRNRLLPMQAIERRNAERIKAFEDRRKGAFQKRKQKTKRNKVKGKKRL